MSAAAPASLMIVILSAAKDLLFTEARTCRGSARLQSCELPFVS